MAARGHLLRLAAAAAFVVIVWVFVWPMLPLSGEGQKAQGQAGHGQTSDDRLVVEVHYEVLCPDSRYFVLHELVPAYEKVADIIDVRFKPYGKASHKKTETGGYTFNCQHGLTECTGNTVHACAIQHVPDQKVLVEYVKCMIFDNSEPFPAGKKCASKFSIEWDPIEKCASSVEGQTALAAVGDETNSLQPRVSFIPTIVINGSQDGQKNILKDFLGAVCAKYKGSPLPTACTAKL